VTLQRASPAVPATKEEVKAKATDLLNGLFKRKERKLSTD
jgi:hypothetical protein